MGGGLVKDRGAYCQGGVMVFGGSAVYGAGSLAGCQGVGSIGGRAVAALTGGL
jgi:hypothetical protein